MSEIAHLRWLCRRGMKELDLLMRSYLDHCYSSASEADQNAFKLILQMPDPELYDLILDRKASDDSDINRVIVALRERLSP